MELINLQIGEHRVNSHDKKAEVTRCPDRSKGRQEEYNRHGSLVKKGMISLQNLFETSGNYFQYIQ